MPLKLLSPGGGSVLLQANTTSLDYTLTVPAETANLITTATTSGINASAMSLGTIPTTRLPTIPRANIPAGCIIQFQSYTLTTSTTTTSQSYVDTGLTVNITPTNTSNKIYILATLGAIAQATGGTVLFNLVRNGTNIAQPTSPGSQLASFNAFNGGTSGAFNATRGFYDSPATTSLLTYKVQWRVDGGTGYLNRHSGNTEYNTISDISVMEIAV